MRYLLKAPNGAVTGDITLEGSKSISNRLLVLRALSDAPFVITNLSPGDDTDAMLRILNSQDTTHDVGAAGTTMRFLTSYFSITSGARILTGSERMQNRPIGILVEALKHIGADIEYLKREGYPPLKIQGKNLLGGKIKIRSDVSSQYLSSLLMIAPRLVHGLELELEGKIASMPYLVMTLKLMESLGAVYFIKDNIIQVLPGKYTGKMMQVEGDWSAASYYYAICALQKGSMVRIHGLFENSLQGDSVLPAIYSQLGVQSSFAGDVLILQNNGYAANALLAFDFSDCPDLAQTVAVTCAGLGVEGKFTGLESLRIKETDRTSALAEELKKFNVLFFEENGSWILQGKTKINTGVSIKTYEDHRMAMSFAPLSVLHDNVIIEDVEVVKKSYPSFWTDLTSVGFSCTSVD
jgi:3-phosphoshikimate 1-carboxyvinyltransferase